MAILKEPVQGVTLSSEQKVLLDGYVDLLMDYNQRVNLISRKSVRADFERHVCHCLCIGRNRFEDGSVVVDWGSGGGLPAIPLAVLFPKSRFVAVDKVRKKVTAVEYFAAELGLTNVDMWWGRAEEYPGKADYSVSRATAPLTRLWEWHSRIRKKPLVSEHSWLPGLIALKGGDLSSEIREMQKSFPKVEVVLEKIDSINGEDAVDKFILSAFRL